jgi:hypothetical protein
MTRAALTAGALAAWGWSEAGWLRRRALPCPVPGLPDDLAGMRVAHLSDFHLGVPSPGERAVARAVEWVAAREPDLVCLTGDLLARPRGEPHLRSLVARLPRCYAVLGNHDLGRTRDPFSAPAAVDDLSPARLLRDEAHHLVVRGRRVEVAGVDPRSWLARRRSGFPESDADLRILLCHFPRALDYVRPGRFQLVLAGHMHAGQLTLPYGRGRRILLSHPRAPYAAGLYRRGATAMHVSPGLGTTFVPFRFGARPEVTELVLQRA